MSRGIGDVLSGLTEGFNGRNVKEAAMAVAAGAVALEGVAFLESKLAGKVSDLVMKIAEVGIGVAGFCVAKDKGYPMIAYALAFGVGSPAVAKTVDAKLSLNYLVPVVAVGGYEKMYLPTPPALRGGLEGARIQERTPTGFAGYHMNEERPWVI
jgi:hypothetical protein